jgi:hypothetical protein
MSAPRSFPLRILAVVGLLGLGVGMCTEARFSMVDQLTGGVPSGSHDPTPLDFTVWRRDLAKALQAQPVKGAMSSAELDRARWYVDDHYGPEQWPYMMELRIAEEHDLLRRLWWKKDDRNTRIFIMALYWCSQPPVQGARPTCIEPFDEDSRRFGGEERAQRLEEVRFVQTHLPVIAQTLAEALRDVPGDKARELAEQYRRVSAR